MRNLRKMWQTLLNNERLERKGGDQEDEIVLDPHTDFSLEEGLRRKICIYDNLMTRFLWGGESIFGELPPDALERAKENVSTLWFVGVRERLDDSIILLGRKLGVGLMPYWLRHVSDKRPRLEDTAHEQRELIAEHNALDIELYRFARERFEATAPDPAALADEREELRARSIEVTAASEEARAALRKEATAAQREAELALKRERRAEIKRVATAAAAARAALRGTGVAFDQDRQTEPRRVTVTAGSDVVGDSYLSLEVLNQRIDGLARQLADVESRLERRGAKRDKRRARKAPTNGPVTPEPIAEGDADPGDY